MQKNDQTSNKISINKFTDIPLFWQDRNRDALKLNSFSEPSVKLFFLVKICEALNVQPLSHVSLLKGLFCFPIELAWIASVSLFPLKGFFLFFQYNLSN